MELDNSIKITILIFLLSFLFGCSGNNELEMEKGNEEEYVDPDYTITRDQRLGNTPMIVAYVTEYSELPDPTYLTHINYAHGRFVNPDTGDGGIDIAKPELLKSIVALKSQKPSLKVLLMIGGWGTKADGFSQMARDKTKREAFAEECKDIIDIYGLDGIDIDWEYPTSSSSGIASSSFDTQNFTLMMRDIRRKIGTDKLLTFASSSSADYIDFEAVKKYVDYINVMTYDMGKPPYHNSPLYHSDMTRKISAEESIQKHVEAGMPIGWLNLGIPFYGHGDGEVYDSDVKYVKMDEILDSDGTYKNKNIRKWDDVAKVPYLVDVEGNVLLTYEDEESIEHKCKFIKEKKMLGLCFGNIGMMIKKER